MNIPRPFRLRLAWLPLLLFALSWVGPSRAQTGPSPSPTPAPTPTATPAIIERTVYTPYQQLEQVFENGGRGVFLPYREFLDLWNKLNLPADLKKNAPPVDGVLASAHYTGRIDGDAAVFDALLQFDALKDGWSKVPLGGADLNIAEVKPPAPGGVAPPVLHLGSDGYEAILPAKGSYPAALTVLGKVTRDAGKSTLALRLPRTAASQLELTIPETGLDFTLTPASAFTAHEENGATHLAAFFGSTTEVSIAWKPRATETTLPALVFAETALETTVSPGALRTAAAVDLRLMRAPVGAFEILVSPGQQVLNVEGSDLRDWTLGPAAPDGRQRVLVNLAAPAREKYRLRVTLELPVASLPAKVTVPTVEIARAESQSGTVSVFADPTLAVTILPREGVTQQGVANPKKDNASDAGAGTFLGAYRFLRLPFALDLEARAAEPVVEVNTSTQLTVDPDLLGWASTLFYHVTKAGIFTALVDVPAALGHVAATGGPVEGYSIVAPAPGAPPIAAGYQRLEVRLKERSTGDFSFNIDGDVPRAKPDEAVTTLPPHPVGVARDEGRVIIAIQQSLDPKTTDPSDMRQEAVNVPSDLVKLDPTKYPAALAFNYRGASARPAQLAFTLRKPRVNAELDSRVTLRESLAAFQWTARYVIEYAGIDDLVIDAPPGVADDLQFSGDDIKEKAREDEKDAAGKPTGRKLWHVRLQQKKLGSYVLHVNLERPLPPPAAGKTATVDWPELKTVGPFHETGTVAVVKADNLEITRATPNGLELIDPAELPSAQAARAMMNVTTAKGEPTDVFLAYRYAAHPAALTLEFSKNEFLPVPTALVSYAALNTTLTAGGAETTEAIYWVRNNGRQFLSVVLPERGQMLSDVFVNGQPQQPSRRPDKAALLVRLPAATTGGGNSDAAVAVRMVFAVPADPTKGHGDLGVSGRLRITPPVVEETRVLQAQWSLYLPTGYRYVDFHGSMREVYDRRGWDWLRDLLDPLVPSLGPGTAWSPTAEWQDPPAPPAATGGGFDSPVPKDGAPVVLRGLDAPGVVEVSYRSLAWQDTLEAVAFFLALGFGLLAVGPEARVSYFFIVGVGALILAGAVVPRSAGIWTAVYLGVFAAALAWLAAGSWRWLRRLAHRVGNRRRLLMARIWEKTRRQPPPTPPQPPTVSPTPDVP